MAMLRQQSGTTGEKRAKPPPNSLNENVVEEPKICQNRDEPVFSIPSLWPPEPHSREEEKRVRHNNQHLQPEWPLAYFCHRVASMPLRRTIEADDTLNCRKQALRSEPLNERQSMGRNPVVPFQPVGQLIGSKLQMDYSMWLRL
jgi:hypothetical protein